MWRSHIGNARAGDSIRNPWARRLRLAREPLPNDWEEQLDAARCRRKASRAWSTNSTRLASRWHSLRVDDQLDSRMAAPQATPNRDPEWAAIGAFPRPTSGASFLHARS